MFQSFIYHSSFVLKHVKKKLPSELSNRLHFICIIQIILFLFSIFPNPNNNAVYGEQNSPQKLSESPLYIVFTGEENGYLEPCGCSEKELGGLPRRHTLINLLRDNKENCIILSLGDLSRKVGRQDEIKMEITLRALNQMGYIAHNIGEKDINMGLELLNYLSQINNINLLSSNIVTDKEQGLNIKPYIIKEIKTEGKVLKIGILGILSPKLIENSLLNIEVMDPIMSLKPLLKDLNGETDVLLLLSHAEIEESIQLAEIFPEFDLVISGHKVDIPDLYIKKVKNTYVIPVGEKGKYLGTVTFLPEHNRVEMAKRQESTIPFGKKDYYGLSQYYNLNNEKKVLAVEVIPLDEKYENSPDIERLLEIYQQRLKDEELVKNVYKTYPSSDLTFIGNEDCAICHNKIFKHWEETHHAFAYETLLKVGHEHDPECLSCHTIGLHYFTGFETIESTPKMKGVGCESCHGPGSSHKETQSKDYGKVGADGCITCHEDEHSPKFQFDDYWHKIVHPSEDKHYSSYN